MAGVATAVAGALGSVPGVVMPMKQAQELFEKQIAQDKRFFYASYAENVAHHAEAISQAARLHAQSYAQSVAGYHQSEKIHNREFMLASLQHKEQMQITIESEIREGLRDEFAYKNNRFNTLMVCDTVMLGCAFGLLSDGDLPVDTSEALSWIFHSGLAASVSLLTISLWSSFIVCRRLNQYTAWVLMSQQGQDYQAFDESTPLVDHMNASSIRHAFDNWFKRHCAALGNRGENCLSGGVMCLFIASCGLLQARATQTTAGELPTLTFSICASLTAMFILVLERRERQQCREKRPGTVYEVFDGPKRSRSAYALEVDGFLQKVESSVDLDDPGTAFNRLQQCIDLERGCWNAAPTVSDVMQSAESCSQSIDTEKWLQKAHAIVIEGAESEAMWERDDHADILATGAVASVKRRATQNLGSECEQTQPKNKGVTFSRSSSLEDGVPPSAGEPLSRQSSIHRVPKADMQSMRTSAGGYSRSIIICITNRTGYILSLKRAELSSGEWRTTAPLEIHPFAQSACCAVSKQILGYARTGVEGRLTYEVYKEDASSRGTEMNMKFCNPLVTGELGRYVQCSQEYTERCDDTFRLIGDGFDQSENQEVHFIVGIDQEKQHGREADIGASCGLRLPPNSVRFFGWLEKNHPSDLSGMYYQRRLFLLTDQCLLYLESKADVQPKGQIDLTEIARIDRDKNSPNEFQILMNSNIWGDKNSRAPYKLKAKSQVDAQHWIDALQAAIAEERTCIRVDVIHSVTDRRHSVRCSSTGNIEQLKRAIQKVTRLDLTEMRLMFGGVHLDANDDATLLDVGLRTGSQVSLHPLSVPRDASLVRLRSAAEQGLDAVVSLAQEENSHSEEIGDASGVDKTQAQTRTMQHQQPPQP